MKKQFSKQTRLIFGAVVLVTLAACGGSDDSPEITAVNPAANATNVATNSSIFVSTAHTSSTATATLTLTDAKGNSIPVTAASSSSEGFSFEPTAALPEGTLISASFSETPDGLTKSWSFTVGTTGNLILPTITSTTPVANETSVDPTQPIVIHFSKTMNPDTLVPGNVTLTDVNGLQVELSTSMDSTNTVLTITSSAELAYNLAETLTISGAKDLDGNALAQFQMSFVTAEHGSQTWKSGTSTFIVPDGVTTVSIKAIGGEGGATCFSSVTQGAWKYDNNQSVTAGESLTIKVGGGGGATPSSSSAGSPSTVDVTSTGDQLVKGLPGVGFYTTQTGTAGCLGMRAGTAGSVTISW